jgi:hypothetical protein
MFEQRPREAVVPQTIVRNSRTNSWIVTVPNRSFLAHLGAGGVPERRASVALVPSAPAPQRRIDAPRLFAALVVLIGVTAIAVTLATW